MAVRVVEVVREKVVAEKAAQPELGPKEIAGRLIGRPEVATALRELVEGMVTRYSSIVIEAPIRAELLRTAELIQENTGTLDHLLPAQFRSSNE